MIRLLIRCGTCWCDWWPWLEQFIPTIRTSVGVTAFGSWLEPLGYTRPPENMRAWQLYRVFLIEGTHIFSAVGNVTDGAAVFPPIFPQILKVYTRKLADELEYVESRSAGGVWPGGRIGCVSQYGGGHDIEAGPLIVDAICHADVGCKVYLSRCEDCRRRCTS